MQSAIAVPSNTGKFETYTVTRHFGAVSRFENGQKQREDEQVQQKRKRCKSSLGNLQKQGWTKIIAHWLQQNVQGVHIWMLKQQTNNPKHVF